MVSQRTAAFYSEQLGAPALLKSHGAFWTSHWRTMASLVMSFSQKVVFCTQIT